MQGTLCYTCLSAGGAATREPAASQARSTEMVVHDDTVAGNIAPREERGTPLLDRIASPSDLKTL